MSFETIIYEHSGPAARITLNRPDQMNALNTALLIELEQALRSAGDDDSVRVLVLTGNGRAFCAGADLKAVTSGINDVEQGQPDFLDRASTVFGLLRQLPKPVIAAINGLALAGGLELTMCCDIVIAAQSARLGDAHSNFGVFPGGGGAAILPRKIGLNRAKYLLFTGDFISAQEMKEFGLVNQVVPDAELPAAIEKLVEKLAVKSPLALRRMKEVANQSLDQSQEAALRHETLHLRQHLRSYDMREGLAAFNEKRAPHFRGY